MCCKKAATAITAEATESEKENPTFQFDKKCVASWRLPALEFAGSFLEMERLKLKVPRLKPQD